MPSSRFPIPQGTLDMLILQILSLGAGARLRHRAAAGADLEIGGSGESGLALSGAAPAGTEGLAEGRVEAIGDGTRGQVYALTSSGRKQLAR